MTLHFSKRDVRMRYLHLCNKKKYKIVNTRYSNIISHSNAIASVFNGQVFKTIVSPAE